MGKLLVTGANGFVGRHLCKELPDLPPSKNVTEVVAAVRDASTTSEVSMNILDSASVEAVVQEIRPATVIHLAAISTAYHQKGVEEDVWRVNFEGTANLACSLRKHVPGTHFIFASSAEIYGLALNDGLPKTEESPVLPLSVYAKAKLASEMMLELLLSPVCPVTVLRLFNHIGPGQDERFALPSFAAQIARIESGLADPVLKVGNLEARRDFLDVADVVQAYIKVVNKPDPRGFNIYNIASGKARSIQFLLDKMIAQSTVEIDIETDPSRLRGSSIPVSCGDPSKFEKEFDWTPKVNIDDTIRNILSYWRKVIP